MRHINIPIFIPELACPFQCVFCNQQKISGKVKLPSEDDILEIIETHLRTASLDAEIEVAFFGGSFTGLSLLEQRRLLQIPQRFILEGKIRGIRLSTRPDYISDEILNLLKEMGVTAIELGAQSLVDEVLLKSGRGHTTKDVEVASKMIRSFGFELGLQMMLGLPGDDKKKAYLTAQKIIDFGAQTTRIYPTLVVKDTALEKLFLRGIYQPLSIEQAILQTKEILPLFMANNVKVLRVGLHPSEGLLNGTDCVAGPFHPNFSEMVQTELWIEKILAKIEHVKNRKNTNIEIFVTPKELNFAIGYKAKNKKRLVEEFKTVRFYSDNKIETKFKVNIVP